MRHAARFLAPLLLLAAAAAPARADEAVLADGTRLAGKIMCRTEAGTVAFQTSAGPLRILAPADIREIRGDDAGHPGYIRFAAYRPDWSRLEVLSRTFKSEDGTHTVTLAGAVHIADLFFYRQAQRVLDGHDVVLYEGVGGESRGDYSTQALPGAEERKAELRRPFHPAPHRRSQASSLDLLTSLQLRMGESLDLCFQHEGVDYSHSWWWVADVSADELSRLFQDRKASIFGDFLSSEALRTQQAANEIVLRAIGDAAKSIFTGKPLEVIWKETFARLLASQMQGEGEGAKAEPTTVMQEVLITGRNKVVMEKLAETLKNPAARSIAIFYGAGHNPDLERRLVEEGYRPVRDEWLPAWEIRAPAEAAPAPAPAPRARREPTLY